MCKCTRNVVIALFSLAAVSVGQLGFGQQLQMGLDGVAWENNNSQGPLLYRTVPAAQLMSVRAKISAQTTGNWSQAGVMVRVPNPIPSPGIENWQSAWSFRPAGGAFTFQSNDVTNGVEAEVNNGNLTAADLTYVRLDNLGAGVFQAYRGSGPDDAHITWTPAQDAMAAPATQTNANLATGNLQVGLAGGAIGALPGASVLFDWAEIQTTTQTYRDDFNYTRDFAANGVLGFSAGATSGGAIWNAIENASAGGTPTVSGPNLARCVACTWGVNGSGNFGVAANYGQSFLIGPSQNDNTVLFGSALTGTGTTAVVYANQNATVKELDFDNANKYVLAGPATITLDADSGNSVIHVITGAHEIQTKLSLNKNVVATAEAGTTLNVNAQVFLNSHTFTTAGTGIINLNDGTVSVGSGAGAGGGAGSLVNEGNLSGLGGLEGNLVQTSGGSLALEVGGNPVAIQGSADLSGTLDLSLAPGFVPQSGQLYTLLTADSVTSSGLSLSGAAAGLFHLVDWV